MTEIRNANVLLSLMADDDFEILSGRATVVDLVRGTDLAIAGEPIHYCWFPLSGLASVIAEDRDGNQAEVGVIGFEGAVNGDIAGSNEQSVMRILVQIAGNALKVEAHNVLRLAIESTAFSKLLRAYNRSLAAQAAFAALAYSRYTIEQRLARWALMCADRVGNDHIDLTHEALSIMLGVRRAGVTIALHALANRGAITIRRGGHAIRDRQLLLNIAGVGYGPAERNYMGLVTPSFPAAHSDNAAAYTGA